MRTKEEIISEECAAWDTDLYSSALKPKILKSMDEYAKEVTIDFAKWLMTRCYTNGTHWWYKPKQGDSDILMTNEELFQLYIKQKT